MTPHLGSFILRRAVSAVVLVLVVASAAVLLARLAPGDHLEFELTPTQIAAERHRLGLDAPSTCSISPGCGVSPASISGSRPGIPGGASATSSPSESGTPLSSAAPRSSSRRRSGFRSAWSAPGAAAIRSRWTTRGLSVVLLALPPVVLSLGLLFLASKTGWFPVGGLPRRRRRRDASSLGAAGAGARTARRRDTRAPAIARDGRRASPSVGPGRARAGIPSTRLVWSHAMRLSLTPVLAVYGVIAATLISGSFAVEYVMTWLGLGRLLYDGLIARDANVVAGCAATGQPPSQSASSRGRRARRCRPEGRGSAMRRTRAIGGALLAGLVLAALFAPVLTPTLRCASSPTTRTLRRCVLTSFRPTGESCGPSSDR